MKISAVNSSSNFVSKQKYSPASRGKEQVLTGKSVLKSAIVPTFAFLSAAMLTGCNIATRDFRRQLQENAEKEMIEAVSSNFIGDSINTSAYEDAIEFGKAEQRSINMYLRSFNTKTSYRERYNILISKLNSLLKTATSPQSAGGVNVTLDEKAAIDGVINASLDRVINAGLVPNSRGNNFATKEVYRQQMSNRALRSFK